MARGIPEPHAYLCTECSHLASQHLAGDDADLRAGPYVCTECGCSQRQDGPFVPMYRAEYEAWKAARDRGVTWVRVQR